MQLEFNVEQKLDAFIRDARNRGGQVTGIKLTKDEFDAVFGKMKAKAGSKVPFIRKATYRGYPVTVSGQP